MSYNDCNSVVKSAYFGEKKRQSIIMKIQLQPSQILKRFVCNCAENVSFMLFMYDRDLT